MNTRTCPKCGEVWYSADTITTWVCSSCGSKIKPYLPAHSTGQTSPETVRPLLSTPPSPIAVPA